MLKSDNLNKKKLIEVFKEIDLNDESINQLVGIDFRQPAVFHIGEKPYRIDFLTKLQGLEWDEAIAKVKYFELENSQVPVIDYHHLIVIKMLADRMVDKTDVDKLQRINRKRKPPLV